MRLLDLESTISEVSSIRSDRDGMQEGPRRPATPARLVSGELPIRPQSARVNTRTRPWDAESASSVLATSSQGQDGHASAARAGVLQDPKLLQICEMLGWKAATKFRTVTEFFRNLDADHNLVVDRYEVQDLFVRFNMSIEDANLFFDMLDSAGAGQVDYLPLAKLMSKYIQPGYKHSGGSRPGTPRNAQAAGPVARLGRTVRSSSADNLSDAFKASTSAWQTSATPQLMRSIGARAHQKFRSLKDCFLHADENKDGRVSRGELVRFLDSCGVNVSAANGIYSHLVQTGGDPGGIDYQTFVDAFGQEIVPGYPQRRPSFAPPPAARVAAAGRPPRQGLDRPSSVGPALRQARRPSTPRGALYVPRFTARDDANKEVVFRPQSATSCCSTTGSVSSASVSSAVSTASSAELERLQADLNSAPSSGRHRPPSGRGLRNLRGRIPSPAPAAGPARARVTAPGLHRTGPGGHINMASSPRFVMSSSVSNLHRSAGQLQQRRQAVHTPCPPAKPSSRPRPRPEVYSLRAAAEPQPAPVALEQDSRNAVCAACSRLLGCSKDIQGDDCNAEDAASQLQAGLSTELLSINKDPSRHWTAKSETGSTVASLGDMTANQCCIGV